MSEVRKITIELLQRDESGQIAPTPQGQDTSRNIERTSPQRESSGLLKNYIFNQAMQNAKQMTIRTVEANIDHYLSLSEDYFAENTMAMVKGYISHLSSGASSIIGGAMAGAQVGGVYGAVAGAVIGTISWGYNEVIGYQTKMSSYYRSLNASNVNLDYARRRAGLVDGGKGTEN